MKWFSRSPAVTDDLWNGAIEQHPIVKRYALEDQARLRALAERFLRSMQIRWTPGLTASEEARLSLAMLACLPILHLDLRWYHRWRTVLLVPHDYETETREVDEAGVVHEGVSDAAGEYSQWGTVVISLEDLEASGRGTGFNVVVHECAHVLDNLNGELDGAPPLHSGMDTARWSTVFGEAFADLQRRLRRPGHLYRPGRRRRPERRRTAFDPSAAEAPEEFFAVASELFFERPGALQREYPDVYRELALFYRPV